MRDRFKLIQMTFYRNNTLAYYLIILVIVGNLYTTVSVLNSIATNYKIGISVIFNIILTLTLFLGAIKIKVYRSQWIWFNFGLMAYSLLRNFVIYPYFYSLTFLQTWVLQCVNVVSAILLLVANLITINKVKNQELYRKHHKNAPEDK